VFEGEAAIVDTILDRSVHILRRTELKTTGPKYSVPLFFSYLSC